jgi:biotin operon repressor
MADKNEMSQEELAKKLDMLNSTLKEMLKWSRFQNLPKLKEVLEKELDDQSKKLVFENTDGQKSMRQVSTESAVPVPTIQGWWNRWYNIGILEPSETWKGRLKRICSLKDVGIEMPKVSQRGREAKTKSAAEEPRVEETQGSDAVTENA